MRHRGAVAKIPPGGLELLPPTISPTRRPGAAVPVTIKVGDLSSIKNLEDKLDVKTYTRAVRAGLTYGTRGAKKEFAKGVTSRYKLKSSRVKEDISPPRVIDKGREVHFYFSRKPPTATAYGFRDRGKGSRGQFIKGQTRQIARGFQMFREKGTTGLNWRRVDRIGRTPIDVVHGPSVGSIVLGRSDFSKKIQADANEAIQKAWVKGIERSLRGAFRKGAKLY